MSELFKVFVYGTLKKGYANHYLMQNGTNGVVNFVTAGLTKEAFPLVVGTDASIPFLLPLKGQGKVNKTFYCDDKYITKETTIKMQCILSLGI